MTEQNNLMSPSDDLLMQHHTLSESDLVIIRQHRGSENRLGFAVQLCYMRYPGIVMPDNPSEKVIKFIATQLDISPSFFADYGKRKNTFHEHSLELQTIFGFKLFASLIYQEQLLLLEELGLQTDKGIVLATMLVTNLRLQQVLLPSILVIEELCAEAITRANRRIHEKLTEKLLDHHYKKLDGLLHLKPDSLSLGWFGCVNHLARSVSNRYLNILND